MIQSDWAPPVHWLDMKHARQQLGSDCCCGFTVLILPHSTSSVCPEYNLSDRLDPPYQYVISHCWIKLNWSKNQVNCRDCEWRAGREWSVSWELKTSPVSPPALFILRVSTYVRIRSRLFYEDFYYDLVEMEWILILKLRLLTEMVLIEHLILRFWRHGIQQNWFYWPIFLSN